LSSRSTEIPHASLPAALHETACRLESAGFEAWLVGESLARVLLGEVPATFELATSAPVARCLELFPQSIPTHPDRGVVTVPAGCTPIDLTTLRRGGRVEDDLAHRDFSVLAMAYAPAREELTDPWSGWQDLGCRRLRCVGAAVDRMHEDPLRILRAARLLAEWGLEPDASVEDAMHQVAASLVVISAPRLRRELSRILMAPQAERGLALLRRTGVERKLVRDVAADAAERVAATPAQLDLRLAAWLRGARSRSLLKRLRFGRVRSQHVETLLAHHPLDEKIVASRDRSVLRLLRQLEPNDITALFQMREWELARTDADDAEPRKRLEAVRNAIARVQENERRAERRGELRIDGASVMALLGCEPGRQVGAALRFASEWVAEDPSRNDPDQLRQAILAWSQRADRAGEDH
jgi:tRNA nucleotidyltransferase/poly(A) polymerase